MKREGGLTSRPWLAWGLLGVALVLLALSESGTLGPLESVLGYVVAPVERVMGSLVQDTNIFGRTTRDAQELQRQNEELRRANTTLVQENLRLREYQAETEELRRQLNFYQENPTYGLVGADVIEQGCMVYPCGAVIGRDTNPYLGYLIINVGTRDGVAVGMPVVTGGAAMIGRIARTSPNLSFVQLVNDPASRVAAILQQSRITGILEGSEGGYLYMTDILPDEIVNEGETVISSSIGGLLPRGLILGQIESVSYQESELFQRALVRAAVDYRYIETVLVVTNFPQPDLEELSTLRNQGLGGGGP
jgi:rod shape-determining protein MreC